MKKYKDFCYDLASQAAKIILQEYQKEKQISYKENRNVVTETDIRINQIVIDSVKKVFPDHDILGEERSSFDNKSDFVWVCDPIDGTIPFVNRLPTSTFSLALTHKGKSIVAITVNPFLQKFYYAEEGNGAFLNNKKVSVNKNNEIENSVIGKTWWRRSPFNVDKLYLELIDNNCVLFDFGSVVNMGGLVCSGEFSADIFPGNTAHDVAAIDLLINEAGGKTSNLFGETQQTNKPIKGFIGANKELHKKILEISLRTIE
ncbi:MAG: inositol monophosphatase [archaeon]|nr:inositol monophosphatase [archaeon]